MLDCPLSLLPYEAGDTVCESGIYLCAVSDMPEPVEVQSIRMAVGMCLDDTAAALVTGPIQKEKLAGRGFAFPGHTDFLGELCGVEHPVMAFVGKKLRVSLVTVHCSLAEVLRTRKGALEEFFGGLVGRLPIRRGARCIESADVRSEQ